MELRFDAMLYSNLAISNVHAGRRFHAPPINESGTILSGREEEELAELSSGGGLIIGFNQTTILSLC